MNSRVWLLIIATLYLYNLFYFFLIVGHLECFQFFTIRTYLLLNSLYYILSHHFWLFLKNRFLDRELGGQMMNMPKVLNTDIWIVLSKAYTNLHSEGISLHSWQHMHHIYNTCQLMAKLSWVQILKMLEYFAVFLSFHDGIVGSVGQRH